MLVEHLHYTYSAEKNQQLIKARGISFEQIINAIEQGHVLDVIPHYNLTDYPNQQLYVVNYNGYVYLVPFVEEDKNTIFLKTIFPHRKSNKLYLRGKAK